jgi:hypothetical protein
VLQDLGWCTLCIGVRATLEDPLTAENITHPTAPYVIVLGYEDIIGVPHRLTGPMRGGVFAVKGARHGL